MSIGEAKRYSREQREKLANEDKGETEVMKSITKIAGGLLAVCVLAATQSRAQLVTDDFNAYTNGPLVGNVGSTWLAYSGATPVLVAGNPNGYAVVADTSSQDVGLPFGGVHTNDVLYAGFDVLQVGVTGTAPSYFAEFKDNTSFNLFGRVWVSNSALGYVKFGIENGNQLPPIFGADVATGTWNRLYLVLDQTGVSMVSKLYIGPTNDNNLADFSLYATAIDVALSTNLAFSQFGLRQASAATGAGVENIDNVYVFSIPEPSTILLVGVGLAGLFAVRRRRS